MIGYITLGVQNLESAAAFYDKILEPLGARRGYEDERYVSWRIAEGQPTLFITRPFDGQSASVGNGTMVALKASSPEEVDRIYALARSLGAKDEGAPGYRGGSSFYAGYFRDPDGHKLNAYVWSDEDA